jgi:hypothetical protein
LSGLFQRALEYISQSSDSIPLEDTAGISKEDQKEIQGEIDRIQQDSRIKVTPETMAIKAAKKGFVFPLLVNVFAVLLLAGGGFTLWYLFQRGETAAAGEAATITSAEGKLIEELKKESEAQLLQKNREINDIQSRLQDIDRQRQELQTNMDARVQAREEELRRSLEAALAAERDKLRGQGVSEADISRRLQALEAEKSAAVDRELQSFRQQADEERRRAEANLQNLQAEYQRNLAQASADRQKVLEEAQKREAELRTQMAAQTQVLEQESAEARQQLSRLSEQREKESLAARRLNGLYGGVKDDLQGGRYQEALGNLEAVRGYLDDPAVSSLPAMQERREIELFVVDSISSLVRSQMQQAATDTTSLVAAANLLTDLKSRVVEADELLRTGQATQAEAKYQEALALIPEVSRAHARLAGTSSAEERTRRETLRGELARADAAAGRQDWQGALGAYARALSYLPEQPAVIERLISQVRQAGYELGSAQARRQDSREAQSPLARANQLLEQRDYAAAVRAYSDLISRYPGASQVSQAVQGIGRAVEGLQSRGALDAAGAAELQKAIQDRDSEITALEAQRDRLLASSGDVGAEQRRLQEQLGALQQELSAKVSLIQTLEGEKSALQDQVVSLKSEIEDLRRVQAASAAQREAELQQKITRLERIEKRYNQLVSSYQDYAGKEDALLRTQGESALLESKLYLNAFLAASAESFPGLWDRIKRYDEAFEKAGRASALGDVNDVLIELSLRDRAQAQTLFLQSEKVRYRDNPQMTGLLDELLQLVAR